MTVQWIHGHECIKGNEIANSKARVHTKMPVNPQACVTQSLSNAKRQIRKSKGCCMTIGMGKPKTKRGTAAVSKTIKTHF